MANYKYWSNVNEFNTQQFTCWHCCRDVASDKGYIQSLGTQRAFIYICPNCASPNYFNFEEEQFPSPPTGNSVEALPDIVLSAYEEARKAYAASAYTACTLMCRKILMNVAVSKGADENKNFKFYVNWLVDNNYTPPGSDNWIDHIRKRGNGATHEIPASSSEEAEELVSFCELLLKFVFEFPARSLRYGGNAEE